MRPSAREILDRAHVKPSDIQNIKSLVKLPITRKTDLIELQKSRPPYGGFLAIKPEDIERVFISPGPIYEPLHSARIKWFARAFWAAGFRKGDIVINTFTYHLSPAGILMHEGLRHCGATVIPTGTGNTEIQIQTMRDLKVNGYVGTPSFLMTIIKKAEEMGLNFRNDFALERAWFTGEMLSPSVERHWKKTTASIPGKLTPSPNREAQLPTNARRNQACILWTIMCWRLSTRLRGIN